MLQVLRSSDLEEIVKLSTNKNKSGNTETISPCNLKLLSKCKVYSINIIDYNTKKINQGGRYCQIYTWIVG